MEDRLFITVWYRVSSHPNESNEGLSWCSARTACGGGGVRRGRAGECRGVKTGRRASMRLNGDERERTETGLFAVSL